MAESTALAGAVRDSCREIPFAPPKALEVGFWEAQEFANVVANTAVRPNRLMSFRPRGNVHMATDIAEGFKQGAETLQVSMLSDAARHSA